MRKEPRQKRCKWCQKWFGTIRDGRFCKDSHRARWHRQKELDENLKIYEALRKALEFCCQNHPELTPKVNQMLKEASVDLQLDLQMNHLNDLQS